jgi:hypothetical protein
MDFNMINSLDLVEPGQDAPQVNRLQPMLFHRGFALPRQGRQYKPGPKAKLGDWA